MARRVTLNGRARVKGRVKLDSIPRKSNPFFQDEDGQVEFFTTGCKLLDLVLGGGWVVGRIINVVGDKAVGKTLLAIEACANFRLKYPDAPIVYKEVESSFDQRYAEALGMPVDDIHFLPHTETIEEWEKELLQFIDSKKDDDGPGLFILDSLDALSDAAEKKTEMDQGTYGMSKAKQMSTLFRKHTGALKRANITLMIISQIRDKVNVTFGKKTTRAGGRALDFYASQVLFLANLGMVSVVRKKVKRKVAVKIKAMCEKNKVGLPFRDCEFQIRFGYGVDDLAAGVNWLKEVGRLGELGDGWNEKSATRKLSALAAHPGEVKAFRRTLNMALEDNWKDIETEFMPEISKY